ncbi:MAG TPA: ISNCY family transposase, partial [Pirellulales bacterium]|nr:ISNCY family transposase [Pirellulales bacterium]
PSNRGSDSTLRERVVALVRERYADFGPTLVAEYLAAEHQIALSAETVRRWLTQAGLWQPKRKPGKHRRWRPRKEHVGELVQMDGSEHDWFEGRRPKATLMVMIDDATNWTHACFFESETTHAAMTIFAQYVKQRGLPRALYVDHDSIYETTRDATTDEELRETGPKTQFGRAMQELEVELILAHSPQAKGRVERRHAVFQDRLIKALRLAGIDDLQSANRFLEQTFLPDLQQRFVVAAASKTDLHRRVPPGTRLERVLAFQEERTVQNDWTVQWRRRWFQISERERSAALARKRVLVVEQLDGQIELVFRGRALTWQELPERPRPEQASAGAPQGFSRLGHKPAANHPWRAPIAAASPGPCLPGSASALIPPALRLASRGRAKKEEEPVST